MKKIIVATRAGVEKEVNGEVGRSIMEIVRDNGFEEMLAICGGCCSCATCHIYVDPEFSPRLPAMSEDENDLLDGADQRQENSRLACQIKFSDELDGLRVVIASED